MNDSPRRLAIEQSSQLDGSRSAAAQVVHQKLAGDSGMNQALDQQYVLADNGEFVAEENLKKARRGTLLIAPVPGLDELANDGYFQNPNQVGHENEAIFEQCQGMDCLALIVGGDLPSHFAYAFLNLLRGNHGA
jgi:hypothetical protein